MLQELFKFNLFKANQGKLMRRLTFWALFMIFAAGAYNFYLWSLVNSILLRGIIACAIVLLGTWVSFRLTQWPVFANFLIDVDAEMVKVSWPGSNELKTSTIVVLVLVAIITTCLFFFDLFWWSLFTYVFPILKSSSVSAFLSFFC